MIAFARELYLREGAEVIVFFTVRFFWKVLANPIPPDTDGGPDIPFKDA